VNVMSDLLRLPEHLQLQSWQFNADESRLAMTIVSTTSTAPCPICLQPASRIHSRYERTLADLLCAQSLTTWTVRVRKFFCANPACVRRIFAKRLGEVAAAWARKTSRLMQRLTTAALTLGGQAAARLVEPFGLPASASTLLRSDHRLPLSEPETPTRLGPLDAQRAVH
jgi:transposase